MVKCVVWDLDNTLWDGTLLEGDAVQLRPGVLATLEGLDARGILNSVASRNEPAMANDMLTRLRVSQYFVAPQIGFEAKSRSVMRIAEQLNLGVASLAFVDDDPFERAEVASVLPELRCFDAVHAGSLPELLGVRDVQVTAESRARRAMYQAEDVRQQAEDTFSGSNAEFLQSLGLVLTITPATALDLERAQELTARTSQLNTSGRAYSLAELEAFRTSPTHRLLIVAAADRFGSYGRVGLVILEVAEGLRRLKLLLTSCRVMSRGVGAAVLNHLLVEAHAAGARFVAEFVQTERNRITLVMFRFAGLRKSGEEGGVMLLEHALTAVPAVPEHIRIIAG